MNNIIKQNENFTITTDGAVVTSQRALASLCGVVQSTINEFYRSRKIDVKQGVTEELAILPITHYAADRKNGTAFTTLGKLAQGGIRALGYAELNYKPQPVAILTPMELMELQFNAHKELVAKVEDKADKEDLAKVVKDITQLKNQPRTTGDVTINKNITVLEDLAAIDPGLHVMADIKISKGWKPGVATLVRLLDAHGFTAKQKRKNVTLYNVGAVSDAMRAIVALSEPKNKQPNCKTRTYQGINFVWVK